jgi:hypothetical protein
LGPIDIQELIPIAVARLILDEPFGGRPLDALLFLSLQRMERYQELLAIAEHLRLQGDHLTFRAVLALERGDTALALKLFRQAQPLLLPRLNSQTMRFEPGALRVVQDALEMLGAPEKR